ncbi:MAG: hypothetical protein KTR27_08785 [Leptolyngbyaceae cyanobacterium MAG.088]|nr:hypothetical protein [Leptolyngbyaceae cyanobacterium MAG.088]
MKNIGRRLFLVSLGLLLWISVALWQSTTVKTLAQSVFLTDAYAIAQTQHQGWQNAWVLSNGNVEAVIVPEIGRIMQFRFKQTAGSFWENAKLWGKPTNPRSTQWLNFGGDKVWPAPQSDWPAITGRGWPPPIAFDAMPVEVQVTGNDLTLISPIDPNYGIRIYRTIHLDPQDAIMTVTSTYEKVEGLPQTVSVWTITQLQDPIAIYAPIPQPSIFEDGYIQLTRSLPANLQISDDLLSLTRDPKESHKIGTDASTLLWVGTEDMIRIDSTRLTHAEYPDGGSSAEIYTNWDGDAYVELEFLGPLELLEVGDHIQLTTTYTLMHRMEKSTDREARNLLLPRRE